jgi:hypothetical protein
MQVVVGMWEANQDVRVGMVGSHQPKRFNEVGSGYTKQYRVPPPYNIYRASKYHYEGVIL